MRAVALVAGGVAELLGRGSEDTPCLEVTTAGVLGGAVVSVAVGAGCVVGESAGRAGVLECVAVQPVSNTMMSAYEQSLRMAVSVQWSSEANHQTLLRGVSSRAMPKRYRRAWELSTFTAPQPTAGHLTLALDGVEEAHRRRRRRRQARTAV